MAQRSIGDACNRVAALLGCGLLAGCSAMPQPSLSLHTPSLEQRLTGIPWHTETIEGAHLSVNVASKRHNGSSSTITVYVEGDGQAWLSRQQLSENPTPRQPVALQLALQHAGTPVAYLARPCQYTSRQDKRCQPKYWSSHRFSEEVIEVSNRALTHLKAASGADDIVLIAYSGGAAVAVLLAARRGDVSALITVAGNLDPQAWSNHHRVSALSGSLRPADTLQQSPHRDVLQIHLVGENDQTVPASLTRAFAKSFGNTQLLSAANNTHRCCWVKQWPTWQARLLAYLRHAKK